MSDDKDRKDEIVRDTLNVSGVRDFAAYTADTFSVESDRNSYGYPRSGPLPINTDPFPEIDAEAHPKMISFPSALTAEQIAKVIAFIRVMVTQPKVKITTRPESEPETEVERRERLLRTSIGEYAQSAVLYAAEVCSMRDQAGRPFPSTPEETSRLMKENRRLMTVLMDNTKDLGYRPEEIHYLASEAEKEISTSIVQEGKPFLPDESKAISVFYTNHRGESGMRRIIPIGLWFGATDYHPREGWLMDCWDLDKAAKRTYSLEGFPGVIFPFIESSSARTTGEEQPS